MRVRTAIDERLPAVQVLALPLDLCDRYNDTYEGAVRDLFAATVPGWRWELDHSDDAVDGGLSAARHAANLRGENLLVLERRRNAPPLVAFTVNETRRPARRAILVVARFYRSA